MPRFEIQVECIKVFTLEADSLDKALERVGSGNLDPDETIVNDTIVIGQTADD